MGTRTSGTAIRAAVFAGALMLAQVASAGRVIVNSDEWTLDNYGFSLAPSSTAAFAQNLASYMNSNGGACNLLIYSDNLGFIGSSLNSALAGAGCSVTHSTGAFDLATLSAYDGVFLGGRQYNYDADVLTAYVNGGGNVYIGGGTGNVANEDSVWDSFLHAFGLDFGHSYTGITGVFPISGGNPLLNGVTDLYFDNINA